MAAALVAPLLLTLAGGHAVADYGLQSEYMSIKKVRSDKNRDWLIVLSAHSLIHAFMVLILCAPMIFAARLLDGHAIGQSAEVAANVASALFVLEFLCHFVIDDAKGQKAFSYAVDQCLHYGCKLAWVGVCMLFML